MKQIIAPLKKDKKGIKSLHKTEITSLHERKKGVLFHKEIHKLQTWIVSFFIIMGKHGEAFLYLAVSSRDAKNVQQFLHIRKVNPNKMPKILLTRVKTIVWRLLNPADVNIECEYEMRNKGKVITCPLFMALEMNNLALLQLLLYRSTVEVDLECMMSLFYGDCVQDVSTPINQAVVLRHPAIVQKLIKLVSRRLLKVSVSVYCNMVGKLPQRILVLQLNKGW